MPKKRRNKSPSPPSNSSNSDSNGKTNDLYDAQISDNDDKIAKTGDNEFEVEKVLDMRLNTKENIIEYLIKWKGYNSDEVMDIPLLYSLDSWYIIIVVNTSHMFGVCLIKIYINLKLFTHNQYTKRCKNVRKRVI